MSLQKAAKTPPGGVKLNIAWHGEGHILKNTCLFIGCSLSDLNLRRLLDVAARSGESPRHFAFLKREEAVKKESSTVVYADVLELYKKNR